MWDDSLGLALYWDSQEMRDLFDVQMDEFRDVAVELGNCVGVAFDEEHKEAMRENIKSEMEIKNLWASESELKRKKRKFRRNSHRHKRRLLKVRNSVLPSKALLEEK